MLPFWKEAWRLMTTVTEDPNAFICGPLVVRRKTLREFAVTPFAIIGLAGIAIIMLIIEGIMSITIHYDSPKASRDRA